MTKSTRSRPNTHILMAVCPPFFLREPLELRNNAISWEIIVTCQIIKVHKEACKTSDMYWTWATKESEILLNKAGLLE